MTERNRNGAARRLLADIEQWTRRTGTPEGKIGQILFRHGGFVGLLRKRLTVTPEKEAAVRDFLRENSEGIDGRKVPVQRPSTGAAVRQALVRDCLFDLLPDGHARRIEALSLDDGIDLQVALKRVVGAGLEAMLEADQYEPGGALFDPAATIAAEGRHG